MSLGDFKNAINSEEEEEEGGRGEEEEGRGEEEENLSIVPYRVLQNLKKKENTENGLKMSI